jgi:hypothetical protein
VCPGDLVCQEKRCVRPGSRLVCDAEVGSGGSSGSDSSGGSGSSGGSSSLSGAGTGGGTPGHTSGEGGAAGDAGAPGGRSGGAGPAPGGAGADGDFAIVASLPKPPCTDRELRVELAPENGTAPYVWNFVGHDAGLTLTTTGAGAALTGMFASSAEVSVTIRASDASGAVAQRELTLLIHETPVVDTITLASVCSNELYAADLLAHGGDSSSYVWTSDISESTGLAIDGQRLSGHFVSTSDEPSSIELTVRVESDGCSSEPVPLTLLTNADVGTCPRIGITSGDLLVPAPCLGSPYELSFGVTGGEGPFAWHSVATPSGLSFDENDQTVTGVGEAGGTLSVEVKDESTNRTVRRDYVIDEPRDRCWLAYLAPATGTTQLHLFDPLLENRRHFPDVAQAEPVTDFKFSPDGHFVAYRSGVSSAEGRLVLLDLTTLSEQTFSAERATHYSWSLDSGTLAVAFDTDTGRQLGGIDVASVGSSPASHPEITPVLAAVDTELAWFAGSNLAFLTAYGVNDRWPTLGKLTPAGFELAVHYESSFIDDAYLLAGAAGVFVVPAKGKSHYFDAEGSYAVPHENVLIAPRGNFVARAVEGTLEVFRASEASGDDEGESTKHSGCEAVLAWAADGARLACSAPAGTEDELVVFDVDPDTAQISDPVPVRSDRELPPFGATGFARQFAESGARLAFVDERTVYSARVVIGSSFVDFDFDFPPASSPESRVVLGFSPNEQLLLVHRGKHLSLFDLDDDSGERPMALEQLPTGLGCQEDFAAPAGTHCGSERTSKRFAWSPDSTLVAFGTEDGALLVKDLRLLDQSIVRPVAVADDCGADCNAGERFAFQPMNQP